MGIYQSGRLAMKTVINLWDSNFPNAPSSVMGKTPRHIKYVRRLMEFDGVTIFTDEYINADHIENVKSKYKIGWLHEPYCLHPQTYRKAFYNVDKFDAIMTYYVPFTWVDKAVLCPYAGIWIPKENWNDTEKTKMVSMLYGGKRGTEGHKMRHNVAESLHRNRANVDFYGYTGQPVDYSWQTKHKTLASYRFSVITETCREDNLFTEWLLDCFAMKTVPIFYGCPNLKDWFDERGVLSFYTVEEAVSFVREASESLYDDMSESIEANYKLCAKFEITEDWFYENILLPGGYVNA